MGEQENKSKKGEKKNGDSENELLNKQSAVDKAANIAREKNEMSEREDTANRNNRQHSEKVSGKGSKS